jgi:phospholipid/cholesterol/gamma-HCH transport system substrate-binding protein
MRRRDEVLVGIFVTAAVIVAAVGTLWLVRGGLSPGYPLFARFPWGAGVKEGQPVWLVGVSVGFIDKVELDPAGSVVIAMRINNKYKIPKTSTAALVANGFFGDQAIGLQPAGPSPVVFAPGDTVPTRPSQTGLQALTQRADTISEGLTSIMQAARSQFVDSGGLREMRQTMSNLNRLVTQLGGIAAIQSAELQSTIALARHRIGAIDSLQVDSTVRSLQVAAHNLSRVTSQFESATDRLNALLAKADSGNGSLAKLINSPAAHDSVLTLISSMNAILLDFKKNPRKYFSVKIF